MHLQVIIYSILLFHSGQDKTKFCNTSNCVQTLNLYDKQSKCTCHYFNLNGNYVSKSMHTKLIASHPIRFSSLSSQASIIMSSLEYTSHVKYILTTADFYFCYDVRSALLDIIDRVVAMDDVNHLIPEKKAATMVKNCLPNSSTNNVKDRRSQTSIAIQTSFDYGQRRNAKVQTNTVTFSPVQSQNLSSSRLFLN
ncbi:unnamed protein product [Rotaria socialis]